MPLAAWRENSSRHVASLRRIRLVFFIAPVSSTITGRDYPQWTDLRKYVAELPVTSGQPYKYLDDVWLSGLSIDATSGPAIFGVNLAIAEPLRGGMGVAVIRARRGSCRAPSTRNAAPGSTAQL